MSLAVELIAVGTELVLGQLVDTNTAHIAHELAESGVNVYGTHTVGDNRARIAAAMRTALERVDGIITTGGLGPTVDDLTKEAVCEALSLDTVLDERSLAQMKEFFAIAGREMRENNRKQALVPRGSFVLENPRGTAPGFIAFDARGKFIACMPGVPREMKPMLAEHLIPYLRKKFELSEAIYTRVLHTINIGESEVDHRISDLFASSENPKIAVLAHEGQCDVKIMAKAATREAALAMIDPLERELRSRLEGFVYGADGESVALAIHSMLRERNATIVVAESCTGGRIEAELTKPAGASSVFLGGIVAYDNAVKTEQVGVSAATIAEHGAVSEAVVRELASGVRNKLHASIGFAVTGIAGPSGGSEEKPVGLVWFAMDSGSRVKAWSFQFRGDRDAVQRRATTTALGLVWNSLKKASVTEFSG